jgi:hypothetical protein
MPVAACSGAARPRPGGATCCATRCLAAGWPLTVSKREEWPGCVACRLGAYLGVGVTAAYMRHYVISK